jgi:hypothetical protein
MNIRIPQRMGKWSRILVSQDPIQPPEAFYTRQKVSFADQRTAVTQVSFEREMTTRITFIDPCSYERTLYVAVCSGISRGSNSLCNL